MTKYDTFRRRVAPIAFGLAIAFIAYQSCSQQERVNSTIVLDFGAAEPKVRSVEAEVWMNDEQVSQFRKTALEGMPIGEPQFKSSLPGTEGEIRLDVELAGGEHRETTRTLHVTEGATIRIQLERDLR